jgi:hypothetical protein
MQRVTLKEAIWRVLNNTTEAGSYFTASDAADRIWPDHSWSNGTAGQAASRTLKVMCDMGYLEKLKGKRPLYRIILPSERKRTGYEYCGNCSRVLSLAKGEHCQYEPFVAPCFYWLETEE